MNSSHGGWKHAILYQLASRELWSISWLWCKKGTELVSHVMLIPGCLVYISCRDDLCKTGFLPLSEKKKGCFTDSFYQCFPRDITGTASKIKFFIKNVTSKNFKIPDPQSHFSLQFWARVTGWKVRNSVTWTSQDLPPTFFRGLKVVISTDIFLHCPLIWRYPN